MKTIKRYITDFLYSIKNKLLMIYCKCRGSKCIIGKKVTICKHVRFILRRKGAINIGLNSTLCRSSKIVIDGGGVSIGNNTCVGENCIFNCFETIVIGNNVVTADNINFITNTHNYEDISKPINEQGGEARPIIVGDGSWIGINSTILDGTVIGKNCVVGAHSLVKGSFPDYCVIAGAPAKIIKHYNEQNKLWIREVKGESSNG